MSRRKGGDALIPPPIKHTSRCMLSLMRHHHGGCNKVHLSFLVMAPTLGRTNQQQQGTTKEGEWVVQRNGGKEGLEKADRSDGTGVDQRNAASARKN